MKNNIKYFSLVSSLFILSQSGAFADSYSDNSVSRRLEEHDKKIRNLESKSSMGTLGVPACSNQDFGVQVDYLFWASDYHMPFATKDGFVKGFSCFARIPHLPHCTSIINEVTARHIIEDNKWSSGYRVGVDWNTHYDNWDVAAIYTYYHNSSHREVRAENGGDISFGFDNANSRSRLNYNVGDLELGRAFFLSRHLVVRPLVGLRTAWINQQFHTTTQGHARNPVSNDATDLLTEDWVNRYGFPFSRNLGSLITAPGDDGESLIDSFITYLQFDLWGLGPRFGFEGNWGDFNGFSLLANVSASLLYSHTFYREYYIFTAAHQSEVLKAHAGRWHLLPNLQTVLGIEWNSDCFGDDTYMVKLSAAWENNIWWNATDFGFFDRSLSLQGLTVSAKFEF